MSINLTGAAPLFPAGSWDAATMSRGKGLLDIRLAADDGSIIVHTLR